ncbi:MAG TPA: hypothetical protein VF253_02445 [Candidatus Limnocylindrales bacterium]|jgi:hypothetical protein
MGGDRRLVVGLALTALIAGGCIGESSLEFGTPVNLHVWTTPTTVEVDAPGWLTTVSSIYLCFAAPPRLPSDGAERENWDPGGSCQDFGTYESPDGFRGSIPLTMLDPGKRPAFEAAADWYVLLVALDGGRATSTISSRFHAPLSAAPS